MEYSEEPQNIFVVRFWREWNGKGVDRMSGWRGRIEHIQSGEGTTFYEQHTMLEFIERFVRPLPSLPQRESEGR